MELRDLAERVLFGTTLEEKLSCPAAISDSSPGPAIATPSAPGRPTGLRFKRPRGRSMEFPGLHQLDRDRERGLLLHFFANHELLATELMALVLLKFPDAPAAFRAGVLQTLKDEQIHTRLYLRRMAACGIDFGEAPLSGYFWRTVSPMEQPVDFVARLSLTFEQANLDYCRYFAAGFARVGDRATARVLQRIYRDEIGHVAHGLKWFRRWKHAGESDWDAFCRELRFPLSPARAKGIHFNIEGRRQAGLDERFIDELNVYSQSRGRTPAVFVFNPFAESIVALGKRFHPVKTQLSLASDLCNLPQYLCRQDDVVLVPRRPAPRFLSSVKAAGFPLPEFVVFHNGAIDPSSSLRERKLARLAPWAWSPDSVELLKPLFGQVTLEQSAVEGAFHAGIAPLYSKAWSAGFLKEFLAGRPRPTWLCPPDVVGQVAETASEVLEWVGRIRSAGYHRIVVKEPYGTAGGNMIRLFEERVLDKQLQWITRAIDRGRRVVIEPWLDRRLDFSIQLEMSAGQLRCVGYTGLINDPSGQFQACQAGPNHPRRLPVEPVALFGGQARRLSEFYGLLEEICACLEPRLAQVNFRGPLGIDACVYADATGHARLKPVVEINPRYTLGRVTLELMRQACPGTSGTFRLVNLPLLRKRSCASFEEYARGLAAAQPLRLRGSPRPRIESGAICLNDPAMAQAYLAVFEVGK